MQPEGVATAKRNESTSAQERNLVERYIVLFVIFGFDSGSKRDCERKENPKSESKNDFILFSFRWGHFGHNMNLGNLLPKHPEPLNKGKKKNRTSRS